MCNQIGLDSHLKLVMKAVCRDLNSKMAERLYSWVPAQSHDDSHVEVCLHLCTNRLHCDQHCMDHYEVSTLLHPENHSPILGHPLSAH